jgi:hypothetical protein
MSKKINILLLICLLICTVGLSQIHRPQNKAIVIFHVIISADDSAYTYLYNVTSSALSEEVLDGFNVYIVDSLLTTNVTDIQGPVNKKWYISGSLNGFIYGAPLLLDSLKYLLRTA